jgi:hypothetical protein
MHSRASHETANLMLSMINIVSAFGFAAVLGSVYASWHAWFAFASRRWPIVPGRVLLAGIYSMDGLPAVHAPHVRYQYTVGGITYESTRLRFGAGNPFSHESARSDIRPEFMSGALRVHYDARNPKRACLIPGPNEWTLALPVGLLIVGVVALAAGVYPFLAR